MFRACGTRFRLPFATLPAVCSQRLDAAVEPGPLPNDPVPTVRPGLLGMLRDEGVGFGQRRRSWHAPGFIAQVSVRRSSIDPGRCGQMGWLPPSADGIAVCQGRGVQSHKTGRNSI